MGMPLRKRLPRLMDSTAATIGVLAGGVILIIAVVVVMMVAIVSDRE